MFNSIKVTPVEPTEGGLHFLLIGKSGVGKTSFALGNLPDEMLPALFINIERGEQSVARVGGIKGVMQVRPNGVAEVAMIQQALAMDDSNKNKPEWARVKTVVIDSLSALSAETTSEFAADSESDTQSPYQPGQRDYLRMTGMIISLITTIKQAGYNFIMIAGVDQREGKQGGPNLSPALKDATQYRMTFVWEIRTMVSPRTGETLHMLYTLPKFQGDGLKTRNTLFRKALQEESHRRLSMVGAGEDKTLKGTFILADPLDDNPPPHTVTLADIYNIYMKAVTS